jgi:hypothetical protein
MYDCYSDESTNTFHSYAHTNTFPGYANTFPDYANTFSGEGNGSSG